MALIDGALWAWGSNCVGHLGLGYCGGYRTIPTLVGSTYASVSAGGYFTIALKPYGPAGRTLWRWGYRTSTPTQITGVSGGDNNWAIIAAGYRHSIAMKSDGSLYGWGFNDVGQLGLGYTSSHIPSPTSIGLDLTP
jgi:alpha-tubulin suppressor-like RCC1 family protein